MQRLRFATMILIAAGFALPSTSRADFNATTDFSPLGNPIGVWSYGYSTTLGGPFIPYIEHGVGTFPSPNGSPTGLDFWGHNVRLGVPAVVHNATNGTLLINGSATYAPGQLGLHPGPNGEDSIIRFTAPTSEIYSLTSVFTGIDRAGTTTDVHVLLNGTSLFNDLINGFGSSASFSTPLNLVAGDRLDFVVGYGTNHGFGFDSTGISATLSTAAVPEPTSLYLLCTGLVGIAARSKRRRSIGVGFTNMSLRASQRLPESRSAHLAH